MLHLFAIHIDWTLSLASMVNAIVGAVLIAVGHGLRKIYKILREYIVHTRGYDGRIEITATVVDGHSEILHNLGPVRFPKVSQNRRSTDGQAPGFFR